MEIATYRRLFILLSLFSLLSVPVYFSLLRGHFIRSVLKLRPPSTSSDDWEMPASVLKDWGNARITFVDLLGDDDNAPRSRIPYLTSDQWPEFSKNHYPIIDKSPFKRRFAIQWDFATSTLLQRPDVKSQPPKLITWMRPPRNVPVLPEPVRLRTCPEMPCRLTTNRTYWNGSAALVWNGEVTPDKRPPVRSHPDQVFVFHDNEPQLLDWVRRTRFNGPAWKNQVNWTWSYRSDSDLKTLYGYIVKRPTPKVKNYTDIVAKKTKMAVWMVSRCKSFSRRKVYVERLQKNGVQVDVIGKCGKLKCPRREDDLCFRNINKRYKFLLAFENAFCPDYISEKFFRYLDADLVVISRASNQHKDHAPPGIYINTNDFKSPEALAKYLKNMTQDEYIQILKKKDRYEALFEDWPLRNSSGNVIYMQYHFEALGYCEMCRRLWNLDTYRKSVPDFQKWLHKGDCYKTTDL